MIVAITEEEGVVHYLHTRRLIDGKIICEFLERVIEKVPRAAILLDNASWHCSNHVREEWDS